MNFIEIAANRHSCRQFTTDPIEAEKMNRILDAIRFAPTAGNLQAYTVRVVNDKILQANLAICAHEQGFIAQAPVVLVFFAVPEVSAAKYGERGMDLYCIQDATIACTYAQLAAFEVGLDSCWVGAFDSHMVNHFLQASWTWRPVAMLPIGYRATKSLTGSPKSDRVQVYDSDNSHWCSRLR
jgi:nitroreductase